MDEVPIWENQYYHWVGTKILKQEEEGTFVPPVSTPEAKEAFHTGWIRATAWIKTEMEKQEEDGLYQPPRG